MNKVILIGRLTKDVELKFTPNGKAVANVTIAVDRYSKDAGKEADFVNVVVWNKNAENMAQYLSKGRQVAIEGSLRVRSYEDKDNNKRWVTEVWAERVEFVGGKSESGGQQQAAAPVQQQAPTQQGLQYGQPVAFSDEDLPF